MCWQQPKSCTKSSKSQKQNERLCLTKHLLPPLYPSLSLVTNTKEKPPFLLTKEWKILMHFLNVG